MTPEPTRSKSTYGRMPLTRPTLRKIRDRAISVLIGMVAAASVFPAGSVDISQKPLSIGRESRVTWRWCRRWNSRP